MGSGDPDPFAHLKDLDNATVLVQTLCSRPWRHTTSLTMCGNLTSFRWRRSSFPYAQDWRIVRTLGLKLVFICFYSS